MPSKLKQSHTTNVLIVCNCLSVTVFCWPGQQAAGSYRHKKSTGYTKVIHDLGDPALSWVFPQLAKRSDCCCNIWWAEISNWCTAIRGHPSRQLLNHKVHDSPTYQGSATSGNAVEPANWEQANLQNLQFKFSTYCITCTKKLINTAAHLVRAHLDFCASWSQTQWFLLF